MTPGQTIEADAARWLVRREEAGWSDADEAAFQAWLQTSMAHKAAFWRLEFAWAEADRIGSLGPNALRSPGRAAALLGDFERGEAEGTAGAGHLGSGDDPDSTGGPGAAIVPAGDTPDADPRGNVIAFPPRLLRPRRWASWREGLGRQAAAAIVALGLVSGTAWFYLGEGSNPGPLESPNQVLIAAATPPPEAAAVETAVGKHKIVRLRDGSRIELNTDTQIRTRLEGPAREVWLEDGEAYFEVKHADNLPFVVHAGARTVTVLGTKFSVVRSGDMVKVSVVEGRVRVDDARAGAPLRTNVITAGDMLLVRGGDTLLSEGRPAQVERDLAWRDGMISFQRQTLGEAAAEFNRYNTVKLVIADPQTASIRIGGTFRASNVETFARLLREAYGLKVEQGPDKITVSN